MHRVIKYVLIVFLSLNSIVLFAQNEDKKKNEEEEEVDIEELFRIDAPVTVELEKEEEERVEPRKKRRKRNWFFGVKTKKGFTRKGFGENLVLELFYYLKDPIELDPYVRDIYWFDFRRKAIRVSKNVDPKYGVVLHGPYQKLKNKQVIEEGYYYYGAKHGRWTVYSNDNILLDKRNYHKGWYKESLVSYYDVEHTKLKEVIPIQYGKKEGEYYYFHTNGNIAVTGKYENDVKVGDWIEYYDVRGRRKKIIKYTPDPYDKDFKPVTLREWDSRGQLIYDREALGLKGPN